MVTTRGYLGNGSSGGLALEAGGSIVILTSALPSTTDAAAVIRVDPATGGQAIVTQRGFLHAPRDLAIEPDGELLVTDQTFDSTPIIIRIDPVTGAQEVFVTGVGGHTIAVVPPPKKKR